MGINFRLFVFQILLAFVILALLQIESFFVESSPARQHGCVKSQGRRNPNFLQLEYPNPGLEPGYPPANIAPNTGLGLPNIVDVNVLGVHVGVG